MTPNQLHSEFTKIWPEELSQNFSLEFHTSEDYDTTLVIRRDNDINQNVEIIIYLGVVLIQENGDDGHNRATFVWLENNPNWITKVKEIVLAWLSSV